MEPTSLSLITVAGSVVAVVGGGFAAIKNAVDLSQLTRTRSREEYKFSKEFFADCQNEDAMHPFAKEKGLQAIAGSTELSAEEIEYLLTLKASSKAIRNFVGGKRHLQPLAEEGPERIQFKGVFRSGFVRFAMKSWYFAWYCIFCACAGAPLLLQVFTKTAVYRWDMFLGTFCVFMPMAIFTLRKGVNVSQAEQLVANEEVDPDVILFMRRSSSRPRKKLVKASQKLRRL